MKISGAPTITHDLQESTRVINSATRRNRRPGDYYSCRSAYKLVEDRVQHCRIAKFFGSMSCGIVAPYRQDVISWDGARIQNVWEKNLKGVSKSVQHFNEAILRLQVSTWRRGTPIDMSQITTIRQLHHWYLDLPCTILYMWQMWQVWVTLSFLCFLIWCGSPHWIFSPIRGKHSPCGKGITSNPLLLVFLGIFC